MAFNYSVFLPGFNRTVWLKEITSEAYKGIIKSLYTKDDSAYIVHSNSLVEQICPGILQEGLNVIDKLILLVNARAISVSPDLKVKATCPSTHQEFEYTVKLDVIFNKLTSIQYQNQIKYKNITVTYSIVKAKDEIHFLEKDIEKLYIYQLASSIDLVSTDDHIITFRDLDFESRCKVVDSLPVQLTVGVLRQLVNTEAEVAQNKLLLADSPFTKTVAIDIPLSTDTNLLTHFSKLLFTDDLNNLYQLTFNLVSKVGLSGEYIDKIPPAEMYLYWALYLQSVQENNQPASNATSQDPTMFNGLPTTIT